MPRLLGQRQSTLELRGTIVGLAEAGLTRREISERVGLSTRQVRRWITRSREDADYPLRTRIPGRRRKTTREEDLAIITFVRDTPFTTALRIREHTGVNISVSTIRKRLKETDLRCRIPAKKIVITPAIAADRLEFCETNLGRNWQNVIFTDEKTFKTSQDTKMKLWRVDGTRFQRNHILPNNQSGRISAGYWGWMSEAGPGEITQITPPKFNARQYMRVLEEVMLPTVANMYPPEELDSPIVFIQDNCPIHRARIVDDWFEDHPEFHLLRWPSRSPDLNPIENLWGNIVREWNTVVQENPIPRTIEALSANVFTVWNHFRLSTLCQQLVASMPRRLQECIHNNGYTQNISLFFCH